MFQRHHYQLLRDRVREPRRFIQVVFGPRQVGKTTTVGQLIKAYPFPHLFRAADAVAAGGTEWLAAQWEEARLLIKQTPGAEVLLVIDEIQKIPDWSETVKKYWDEDSRTQSPIKVILLGSSRILLQQGLTESLAGRYETIYMGHWSLNEMQKAFEVTEEQYVWFGGYPGAASLMKDEERWRKYVRDSLIESSISRDILLLTRVDKPMLMRRLFELGCTYSGQELSYTKMLGQLTEAGNTTTLSHYLHLLDTAGLLGGLEKYAKDVIRKRASSPKFQVHNSALHGAQSLMTFEEVQSKPDAWGRAAESAVGAHLLNACLEADLKLYYWRDGDHEMDFVIEDRNRVIGIEVKSGKTTRTSGAEPFRKKFNPDKIYILGKDNMDWRRLLQTNLKDL